MEPSTIPAFDVRDQFPVLRRELHGRPIVYLDTGASAQKPESVLAAMDHVLRHSYANIHRGVYALAQESTAAFEGARERIAEFIGATPPTTIFTKNASEAINLVAYSWGRRNVAAGDVVLLSTMEHHSNIVPWQILAAEVRAEIRWIPVDEAGKLDLPALDAELASGRVKLVAVTHVSNVLGTINPIADIVARVRAAGAVSMVDGAQAVPQMPVDLREIDPDFYAWTGHKAYGPTGIGVLHGRRELLEAMPPFLGGGDMIKQVRFDGVSFADLPQKFEAGTSPIVEAIGLGAAIDWIAETGPDRIRAHEQELTRLALDRLARIDGVRVVGPPDPADRGGIVSFVVDGMHPHDVAELLDREAVCVRAGHHCAQPLMRALGAPATTRASFGPYNRASDIEALGTALEHARAVFQL